MFIGENFCNVSDEELTDISGGMAPAIVYAAGFVMGTTPLVAVAVSVGAVSGGIALAAYGKKHKNKQ